MRCNPGARIINSNITLTPAIALAYLLITPGNCAGGNERSTTKMTAEEIIMFVFAGLLVLAVILPSILLPV